MSGHHSGMAIDAGSNHSKRGTFQFRFDSPADLIHIERNRRFKRMKPNQLRQFASIAAFIAVFVTAQWTATAADEVIAKGNGLVIHRSQLDEEIGALQRGAALNHKEISPEELLALKRQTLKRMICTQLLFRMATDEDRAIGKATAENELAVLIASTGSQQAFNKKLKDAGISTEELQSKLIQQATATATLSRKLSATVTDAEVKQYYEQHPEKFTVNGKAIAYKEVQTQIKGSLMRQKINALAPAFLDKTCKAANVQILDVSLKEAAAGPIPM